MGISITQWTLGWVCMFLVGFCFALGCEERPPEKPTAPERVSKIRGIAAKNESLKELTDVKVFWGTEMYSFGYVNIGAKKTSASGLPRVGTVRVEYAYVLSDEEQTEVKSLNYNPENLLKDFPRIDEVEFVYRGNGKWVARATAYNRETRQETLIFEEAINPGDSPKADL